MSDWQPARVKSYHRQFSTQSRNYVPQEEADIVERKVVRVKPISTFECINAIADYRADGCDATRFFILHPDDCIPGAGQIVCEHEVFTD
jgi:hypothetical protein